MGRKKMTEEEKMASAKEVKKTEDAEQALEVSIKAEDVIGVAEDGTETPLTELAPELEGETVSAPVTAPQPVYQVVTPKDPIVKILYLDSAIQNNQIPIGKGRVITGSGRIFGVPLGEFEGEFMTPLIMKMIDERKFIVLDGLTDEQREQYNCAYKDGEVLKREGIFDYLISCETEEAVRIFKELCKQHRIMVGTRFISAWEQGDNRITREKLEGLNAVSKADFEDGKGIFTQILQAMAENI